MRGGGSESFVTSQPGKSFPVAAAPHRPAHTSGKSWEMPVRRLAPAFVCPHLFLETTSFPGLAWPEGGPPEKIPS